MLRAAARQPQVIHQVIRNESATSTSGGSSTRPSNPPGSNGFGKILVTLGIGGAAYYAYQNYMRGPPTTAHASVIHHAPVRHASDEIIQSNLPIPNAGDPETISPTLILAQDASSFEILENKLKSALNIAVTKINHVTAPRLHTSGSHFHESSNSGSSVIEITDVHRYVNKLDNVITEGRSEPSTKNHPLLPLADATSKKLHSQLDELENVHAPNSPFH
jgi:hypothetical protein